MVEINYIKDVTPRKRVNIIALRKHTGLSIRNISEKLAIPKSTVGGIIKRAKTLVNHGHYDKEDVEESARQHRRMSR